MSNRGSLVTSPRSRPKMIAETASSIPVFWLSFLTADDLETCDCPGQYEIDRKQALDPSVSRIALFAEAFPDVDIVRETATTLIGTIKSKKSKTIGIELGELMAPEEDVVPPLDMAVKAVDAGDINYSVTTPARTIRNPFTGDDCEIPEKTYSSLADILLAVCMINPRDLRSNDEEELRELIIGHVWK